MNNTTTKDTNMNNTIKPQYRIQLIGVGRCNAKLVKDLQIGDEIIYNYGYTATVIKMARRGKNQMVFFTESNGKTYKSIKNLSTAIAVKGL